MKNMKTMTVKTPTESSDAVSPGSTLREPSATRTNRRTQRSDSYQDYLIETLKDRVHAAAYLTVHLEDEDGDAEEELLHLALSNVFQALGEPNMSPASAKLHMDKLDDLLSKSGSALIYSLTDWLAILGLKLTVTVNEDLGDNGD